MCVANTALTFPAIVPKNRFRVNDANSPAGTSLRLIFEPLTPDHSDELTGLLDPRVNAYFIANEMPTNAEDLRARFERMAAGPSYRYPDETWLNFAVRRIHDGRAIGRIEATIHGADAEVAFLFIPEVWGEGFAREATEWLHHRCVQKHGVATFWATVLPTNEPSLALCRRLGYRPVSEKEWPSLRSYDIGDVVLRLGATIT